MAIRKFSTSSAIAGSKSSKLWDQTTTPGTFESIASITSDGSAGNFTFVNIPQNYAHLQLRIVHRTTAATTTAFNFLFLNGIYGSPFTQYSIHQLYGTGTGSGTIAAAGSQARVEMFAPTEPYSTDTVGLFAATIIDILDYSNTTKNKTVKILSGHDKNGSGTIGMVTGVYHASQAAITQVDFSDAYGNYAVGTQASLYGIRG